MLIMPFSYIWTKNSHILYSVPKIFKSRLKFYMFFNILNLISRTKNFEPKFWKFRKIFVLKCHYIPYQNYQNLALSTKKTSLVEPFTKNIFRDYSGSFKIQKSDWITRDSRTKNSAPNIVTAKLNLFFKPWKTIFDPKMTKKKFLIAQQNTFMAQTSEKIFLWPWKIISWLITTGKTFSRAKKPINIL